MYCFVLVSSLRSIVQYHKLNSLRQSFTVNYTWKDAAQIAHVPNFIYFAYMIEMYHRDDNNRALTGLSQQRLSILVTHRHID